MGSSLVTNRKRSDNSKVGSSHKNWSGVDTKIVTLYYSGMMNQFEIADEFGIAQATVSAKCNSERGKEIAEKIYDTIIEKTLGKLEKKLGEIEAAALEAVEKTVKAKIHPLHKAKSNQDRVAVRILEGRGILKGEEETQKGPTFTDEQFSALLSAVKKSEEASHVDPFAPPILEAEEVVEDDD